MDGHQIKDRDMPEMSLRNTLNMSEIYLIHPLDKIEKLMILNNDQLYL